MRNFKILLAAFALMLTTSTFANFDSSFEARKGSVSYEIEKMLKHSNLFIDNDFTVTVIFTVDEESRINVKKVSSPNEEVNEFLIERLDNQKLHGPSWNHNKVYELPVKVMARR